MAEPNSKPKPKLDLERSGVREQRGGGRTVEDIRRALVDSGRSRTRVTITLLGTMGTGLPDRTIEGVVTEIIDEPVGRERVKFEVAEDTFQLVLLARIVAVTEPE